MKILVERFGKVEARFESFQAARVWLQKHESGAARYNIHYIGINGFEIVV